MNYINYFKHTLHEPPSFERQFQKDLPAIAPNDWKYAAERVVLVALPFISLYRPAGAVLGVVMGATRVLTHLQGVLLYGTGEEAGQLGLSTIALTTAVYDSTLGHFVVITFDSLDSAYQMGCYAFKGEYSKAMGNFLQLSGSSLGLAVMCIGSLELILLSVLFQVAINLYQSRDEFQKGRYLEGFAKLAMASIRIGELAVIYQQIQHRNFFLELENCRKIFERIQKGREVRHLIDSEMIDLGHEVQARKVILTDASGKEFDFGSHFHGFGEGLVKGNNLAFHGEMELDFKVNHVYRDKLEAFIQEIQSMKKEQLQELLFLGNSHATDFKVESEALLSGPGTKITLNGIGSITVGASPEMPNLYDRVIVKMEAGKNLYDFHELLSIFDLDTALHLSTQDDLERLKLGHLYRNFFPEAATPWERSEEFFTLPLSDFKEKMIAQSPGMKEVIDQYYAAMTSHEILPGRVRYRITGLAEECYELGALSLTAALTGAYTDEELFQRSASILKMGFISNEFRKTYGIQADGLSPSGDFYSGGADSVFTQMLTEQDSQNQMRFSDLSYHSKVRFLISLDALETGTYQYHVDSFGTRRVWEGDRGYPNSYLSRPNILDFIQEKSVIPAWFEGSHEIMVKERIPPSFLKGIVVPDQQTCDSLLHYFRSHGIVQKTNTGEQILGIDALKFIHVAKRVSEVVA
jgi:hypothetical protein